MSGWKHVTIDNLLSGGVFDSYAWVSSDPRSQYLALRNGADGSKAHCAYCGMRVSCFDGLDCLHCGATEIEIRGGDNATP